MLEVPLHCWNKLLMEPGLKNVIVQPCVGLSCVVDRECAHVDILETSWLLVLANEHRLQFVLSCRINAT